MDLFSKKQKNLGLPEDPARPRSRTMPHLVRDKISGRFSKTEPQLEISLPTNFKHQVKVKKQSDGTIVGLPEGWMELFLQQVEEDRRNGNDGAEEAGARVLQFFQEFSRDGSRRRLKKPLVTPIPCATHSPPAEKPKLPLPKKPESRAHRSTFYLNITPATPTSNTLPKIHAPQSPIEVDQSEQFFSVLEDEEELECLQLSEAHKTMANAILEMKKNFGEKPTSFKRQTFRPKPKSVAVELRPDSGIGQPNGDKPVGAYRHVSVFTDEQAFEEMKKLCNPNPLEMVYTKGKKLGSGSGGVVYHGVHNKTRDKVAIKSIDLNSGDKKVHLLMEVQVMRELVHPNLVSFLDIFVTHWELFVVMEFMDAGALTDVVLCTILKEPQMAAICKEVLKGLGYLHEHEVVHRDIKSDNILLSLKGAVKITDFGFAANVAGNRMRKTFAGTPYWMAPEIIKRNTYSTQVDVWSMGILALEMLNGNPPYMNETPIQAMYLISEKGHPPIDNDNISDDFRSFLNACLQFKPEKRASVPELLNHKFLSKASNLSSIVPNIKATIQKKKGLI